MISMPKDVFTAGETHGRVLRPGNRIIAQSQDAGWRSLFAAIIEEAPFEAVEAAFGHPFLIYHLARPTQVTRRIEGNPVERSLIGPRRLCLTPGEATTQWQHSGNPEILQVYLRKSVFTSVVGEMYPGDPEKVQIVPRFAAVDPLLEQLALAIASALRDGNARDGLYIDTLAQMIAAHLARNHSSRSPATRTLTAPYISGWKIRRIVEFIEENLDSDLRLEAMAAQVAVSPLYLPRAFKAAVGQSPHQYVLARRIERAKELLRNTQTSIAEVAFSSGFSSQSHLSHWFLKLVGVSPATYRRQGLT
jgi:AraC family transcriptional regulator